MIEWRWPCRSAKRRRTSIRPPIAHLRTEAELKRAVEQARSADPLPHQIGANEAAPD